MEKEMPSTRWDETTNSFVTLDDVCEADINNAEPEGRIPVSDGNGGVFWNPIVVVSREEPKDIFMGMLWLEKD